MRRAFAAHTAPATSWESRRTTLRPAQKEASHGECACACTHMRARAAQHVGKARGRCLGHTEGALQGCAWPPGGLVHYIAKEVSPVYLADHPESFATDRAAGVFASFEEFHSVWLRYCADESLECPKQRMQALVTEKYIEKYQFSPTQQRDSMLSKSPTSSRFR